MTDFSGDKIRSHPYTEHLQREKRWLFIDRAHAFGGHEVMMLRWVDELRKNTEIRPRLVISEGSRLARTLPADVRSAVLPQQEAKGLFGKLLQNLRELRIVLKAIRREQPQLCIFVSGSLADQLFLTMMVALLGYRTMVYVPLLNTFESMGYANARLKDIFVRRLYARLAVDWLAISDSQASDFRQWAKPAGKVHVLPNTVSLKMEGRHALPCRPLKAGEPLKVLVLGRLDGTQKGLDLLVQGLRTETDAKLAEFKFKIVGEGPYGDCLEAARATDSRLAAAITVEGWRDAYEALSDCDVLLLPSRFEGVPLVMLEAMTLGVPVVASDLPGIRDYLPKSVLFAVGDISRALNILEGLRPVQRRDQLAAEGLDVYSRTSSASAFARNVSGLVDAVGTTA